LETRIELRIVDRALVVTFPWSCQVSWAPLLGGFRTGVSHILVHETSQHDSSEVAERALRKAAGRLGLKGTVVGMATSAMVSSQRTFTLSSGDVSLFVAALDSRHGRPKADGTGIELDPGISGSEELILFISKRLSHETMLEVMAAAVEARTIARQSMQSDRSTVAQFGRDGSGYVAVATAENPQERYRESSRVLRELVRRAFREGLQP
jgi:adenosylcobinamide amidohydrolase